MEEGREGGRKERYGERERQRHGKRQVRQRV